MWKGVCDGQWEEASCKIVRPFVLVKKAEKCKHKNNWSFKNEIVCSFSLLVKGEIRGRLLLFLI